MLQALAYLPACDVIQGFEAVEIQLEQAKTESHLIRLDAGEVFKKDIKRSRRDKMLRIKNMVESYSTYPSIISFLTAMSHNMGNSDLK